MTAKEALLKQLFFAELRRDLNALADVSANEGERSKEVEQRLEESRKVYQEFLQSYPDRNIEGPFREEGERARINQQVKHEYEQLARGIIDKITAAFEACYDSLPTV